MICDSLSNAQGVFYCEELGVLIVSVLGSFMCLGTDCKGLWEIYDNHFCASKFILQCQRWPTFKIIIFQTPAWHIKTARASRKTQSCALTSVLPKSKKVFSRKVSGQVLPPWQLSDIRCVPRHVWFVYKVKLLCRVKIISNTSNPSASLAY